MGLYRRMFLLPNLQGNDIVFVLVYVDDLLVTMSNATLSASFVVILSKAFIMQDLGPANFFLGIDIVRDATVFYLSQSKHIADILNKIGMMNSKAISSLVSTTFDASISSPSFKDT